jgi:tetratricopeptide (TPR) repeat protein
MPDLTPMKFRIAAWGMVAVAVVVYVNNVIVLPSLRAPDGFGHFTYIWYLATTGSVPAATVGWSFFHPPLYYAFMASIWNLLPSVDPVLRLKIGPGINAFCGIAQAGVAFLVVRRSVPDNRFAQLLAIGIMLFLPLQLFSAGYLGNERLNAVFCGTSILALIWLLDRPTLSRAAVFGALLGLAMLVKFTALAIVAGSFATIFFSFLFRREYLPGLKVLIVVGVTMLSVCGWFYVRNVVRYGTPIQMSRETEMVQRVEHYQTKGKRSFLEYVLFDPLIITSPQWPRGIPIYGKIGPDVVRSPLRESVWTGLYTNAWFDGIGGQVLPIMRLNPAVLHSGQLILTLALVPTILVLIGIGATIRKLWREGWDDLHGGMLIIFVAMMTVFVYGTKMVVLHAAVKATYMTPISVIFALYLANGFDVLSRVHRGAARGVLAVCAVLAIVSISVFTLGALVGRGYLRDGLSERTWQNVYGVIQYAGGREERALEMFTASALENWHLGHENMAAMALERGKTRRAIRHLRAAARFQPSQSFGLPADRRSFNNATQAEYSTLLSVAYYRVGKVRPALKSAVDAVMRNRSIPEANYNLGVLHLVQALSIRDDEEDQRALLENARGQFEIGWQTDPGFGEAIAMQGVAQALLGECDQAQALFERAEEVVLEGSRSYPLETGTGDMHEAGIRRRLRILDLPEELEPEFQRRRCLEAASK